jgi:hypothetical protein
MAERAMDAEADEDAIVDTLTKEERTQRAVQISQNVPLTQVYHVSAFLHLHFVCCFSFVMAWVLVQDCDIAAHLRWAPHFVRRDPKVDAVAKHMALRDSLGLVAPASGPHC